MSAHAFPMFDVPAARSRTKPRKTGLTMVVDWGIPHLQQQDLLDLSGDYLDLAKFAVVSVRVYTEATSERTQEAMLEAGERLVRGG
jgi:phosphosulfolactate synthase (CoM biosynthesis protein A)